MMLRSKSGNQPAGQASCKAAFRLRLRWTHVLYDDSDVRKFIEAEYHPAMLASFECISSHYGAARADLFRYLLLYRRGGVYLDIKSGAQRPLDEILLPDDRVVLTQWDRKTEARRERFGNHSEISLAGGELQQWQIITVPGHPFLRAVIERVLHNIASYNPWKHGTGGKGVYRVTGPIAYTNAIVPLLGKHKHRLVHDTDIGLLYSAIESSHKTMFKGHYLMRTDPIVLRPKLGRVSGWSYDLARRLKRRVLG